MKTTKKAAIVVTLTITIIGGISLASASFGGHGQFGGGHWGARMGGQIPAEAIEIKKAFKTQIESLSYQERKKLFENRHEAMEERKNKLEEFVGFSHEEIREQVQNGITISDILSKKSITQKDTESFLKKLSEDHISKISQLGNLTNEQKNTLKDLAKKRSEKLLNRWFKN